MKTGVQRAARDAPYSFEAAALTFDTLYASIFDLAAGDAAAVSLTPEEYLVPPDNPDAVRRAVYMAAQRYMQQNAEAV